MIKLRNISKIYGKTNKIIALNDINLDIESGGMTAIMGRSGCGKSTLINIIGGLSLATSGNYYFEGKLLKNNNKTMCRFRNENIGFIVQNYALINNRTAYENIEIALDRSNDKMIKKIAQKLDIDKVLNKFPNEMSGGECQRTAIARAVINRPKLLLADEPTGALDSGNGINVMNILRGISDEGTTVIVVTHDDKIAELCDRTICMEDGRII